MGSRSRIPPSPRARTQYFAWLSIRTGGALSPSRCAILPERECDECAASRDSSSASEASAAGWSLSGLAALAGSLRESCNARSGGEGGCGPPMPDARRPTHLLCALAFYSDEEASARALWVAQRGGEVRTAHDTQLDVAVFDECEADGVLLAEEEALGAVDRVERPHPYQRV